MTSFSSSKEILLESEQFLLEVRLSAIQECIKRTRLALLICTLASVASLVCVWNTALSVDKLSYFRLTPLQNFQPCSAGQTEPCTPGNKSQLDEHLVQALASKWMDSTFITVPLLGVSISVLDFSVFNSSAMLFFTLYLLLAERRENREVGSLLRDLTADMYMYDLEDFRRKFMVLNTVYRAICSFMIFNVPTHRDNPIDSIEAETSVHDAADETEVVGLRKTIKVIFFLPLISLIINFGFHAYLIMHSNYLWNIPNLKMLMYVVEGWELSCLFYVLYLTMYTRKFHDATRTVIRKFNSHAKSVGETKNPPQSRTIQLPINASRTTWDIVRTAIRDIALSVKDRRRC